MKKDKYDNIFSLLVRARSSWTCESCYQISPEGFRDTLHCGHIIGRSSKITRYAPDNAFALCFNCHRMFTDDEELWREFVFEKIGEDKYFELKRRSNERKKLYKSDLEAMFKHYKNELKRIETLRNVGITERIEFSTVL